MVKTKSKLRQWLSDKARYINTSLNDIKAHGFELYQMAFFWNVLHKDSNWKKSKLCHLSIVSPLPSPGDRPGGEHPCSGKCAIKVENIHGLASVLLFPQFPCVTDFSLYLSRCYHHSIAILLNPPNNCFHLFCHWHSYGGLQSYWVPILEHKGVLMLFVKCARLTVWQILAFESRVDPT